MFKLEEIKLIKNYVRENRDQLVEDLNSHEYKDNREDTASIVNEIRKCNSIIEKCDNFIKD
jgi:hypothetical protein